MAARKPLVSDLPKINVVGGQGHRIFGLNGVFLIGYAQRRFHLILQFPRQVNQGERNTKYPNLQACVWSH